MKARLVVAGLALIFIAGCASPHPSTGSPASSTGSASDSPSSSSAAGSTLLAQLRVIEVLPDVLGYDRSCRTANGVVHGCVFGLAWSDDTTAPSGHNGCDSRTDAVAKAARQVVRSGPCKVLSGILDDPYTGRSIPFTTNTISSLSVDHLVPLKRAWDLGASSWSLTRRAAFANDVDLELIVTTAAVNSSKGDKGIGQWQPPNPAFRCQYAQRYVAVSLAYGLPVTRDDLNTLSGVLASC